MKTLLGLVVLCLLLTGTISVFAAEPSPETARELSADEQTTAAFDVFQQIYKLTEDEDRAKVLPQIEAGYEEIIAKYPKAAIVHESYWRLATIYLSEHQPPQFDKAENLYADFTRKYPDSPTKGLLADTLVNTYHRHAQWEKIIRFLTPSVKQFIATGSLAKPQDMFFYSEAKFNLGDMVEAEKGYKIVASLFAQSKEAKTARLRLDEIQQRKVKTP